MKQSTILGDSVAFFYLSPKLFFDTIFTVLHPITPTIYFTVIFSSNKKRVPSIKSICGWIKHCSDVICSSPHLNSTTYRLFLQQPVRANNKETTKASHYCPVCEGNPPVTGGFPSQRDSNASVMTSPPCNQNKAQKNVCISYGHTVCVHTGAFLPMPITTLPA